MNHFKVLIFTGEKEVFNQRQASVEFSGIEKENIIWADSSRYSRQHYINANLNQWLFFLDHDCHTDAETFSVLEKVMLAAPGSVSTAVAGRYENPVPSSLLQRAHNFIANGWLEHSFQQGDGVLLGGIFLIYSTKIIEDSSVVFWGAEDKALSYQLKDQGFNLQFNPRLRVVHRTSRKFFHFLRRAWLHGTNEVRYLPKTRSRVNYLYWLGKVDLADLSLVPLIVLHFCIQKAGLLFQTIRPGNK